MSSARQARAVAQSPAFAWPQLDLRQLGFRVLPFAFCLISALLLTASRLEITRLRYELSDLNRQRQTVSAGVARLEVETATLASPQRIEGLAREMGFVHPGRESMVVLDE